MESITFKAMGTTINLQIEHEFSHYLLNEAKKRLLDYENRFSANDANSLLMKVNQFAGIEAVAVDPDIFELIKIGKVYSVDLSNTLNIAIGPLIKLWKIGFSDAKVPSQAEIDERLTLIDPNLIQLNDEKQSVYLERKGMEIDLGALAKGFFADQIKHFLKKAGVKKGIIDLGGNVLLLGSHPTNPDTLWRVGVQNPFMTRNNLVGLLKVKDKSVVTSGIYERTFVYNGEEYHHIFDSKTGYPVKNNIASLTIVSKESLTGELYTTMYYKAEAHDIIRQINQIQDVEAVVITKDSEILITHGLVNDFIKVD